MQKVYSDQTLLMVTHIQNLLESAHITSAIRNEYAAGGVGELSFIDAWPEVWVEDEDVVLAKKVIDDYLSSVKNSDNEWRCSCGELNGAAFSSCWSCQRDKPFD